LIHGWSCEGRYWDEFGYVGELSGGFRVVLPDLRGHGESGTPPDRDFSDAAFASDVIAVLDELEIDSAHMFGYSLGGWVVFELAVTSPSRVKTAIVGGAHPYDEDLSAVRAFAPAEILNTWEVLEAPLSQASRNWLADIDQQVLIDVAVDRIDQTERLGTLQLPCLMICGTKDWRLEDMRRFSQDNNRCEFVSLEGPDHLQT
jgi:pimeloyl-ACP methyl ester carboxylesterase